MHDAQVSSAKGCVHFNLKRKIFIFCKIHYREIGDKFERGNLCVCARTLLREREIDNKMLMKK